MSQGGVATTPIVGFGEVLKAPLVDLPAGEPDPLAVVDQHVRPEGAPVGEEVGVMRERLAEDWRHLGVKLQ